MRRSHGFTLLETLVALGVALVLAALVVPTLGHVSAAARRTSCLSNLRQLQLAHTAYLTDHRGRFIDAGLPHGGLGDETVAWVNTLRPYADSDLVVRSPLDTSPHWPVADDAPGVPLAGTTDRFRRTSYGLNNYLTRFAAVDQSYDRFTRVKNPVNTVHFLVMAFEGDFAGSDHCHVEGFWLGDALPDAPPRLAPEQGLQTDAAGGPSKSWASKSNYGFLDGHVATHTFAEVYRTLEVNRFDPGVSQYYTARVDP